MRSLFSSSIHRRWLGRFALAGACAIALSALPVSRDGKSSSEVAQLADELREVRAQIAEQEAANARLRMDINALRNDPRAIERAGRDQLGLVYASDIVVRVSGSGAGQP